MSKLPVRVDKSRWQEAQAWELQHWLKENSFLVQTPIRRLKNAVKWLLRRPSVDLGVGNDSNEWWQSMFENYQTLPKQFGRVVELGCGPYTNIRLIKEGRTIDELWCSDPLAEHYVTFKSRWLAEAYRQQLIRLDTHPIEQCPFESATFDLVVVINVLDHVQDAGKCLAEMCRITAPGGYLVFGQELSDEADLEKVDDVLAKHGLTEDIGHPIRLHHTFLDNALLNDFEPVLYRLLPRDEGRVPECHYGTYIFIGRRK